MTAFEALRSGVAALRRHPRMVALFYVVNAMAALLITAPLMAMAFHSLGESAWAGEMAGNLDLAWISELIAKYGAMPWDSVLVVASVVGVIAVAVYLFLLGGALQVLCTGEPFFAGCGRNFWRMVRLAMVSAVFYGIALALYALLGAAGRKVWGEGSEAGPEIHWSWFCLAALLLMLGYVNLVFDYARVRIVAEDSGKAFRSAAAGFRFVWRNFRTAAGLYILVCAIAALFFGAYLAISLVVAQTTAIAILVLFLIRQAAVLGKMWSRLLFCSTAIELYGALKPPPPAVVELPEPEAQPEPPAEPVIEIALAPELEVNAFQFVTAWNQTPECRAVAEARLPGRSGVSGVIFDPSQLTGSTAVLTRLREDAEPAALDDLVRRALDRQVSIVEETGENGPRRLAVTP